jgi:hypothetical protein
MKPNRFAAVNVSTVDVKEVASMLEAPYKEDHRPAIRNTRMKEMLMLF